MSAEFDTYCGLSCKDCTYRETSNCGGCIATEGKPFHGICDVAECAKAKNRRFCGECGKFPCELLKKYSYDPAHGDDGARIENCKRIKTELVAKAREGVDPLAVCGFDCDQCFMGRWCGGCRSSYNCCSYGTLFDGNVCPNVACAKEKNVEGCYQCADLDNCKTGFYAKEDEHVAKAAALMIRQYGRERAGIAFQNVIKQAKATGKTLEKAESVEAAFDLLKSCL